VTTPLPSLIYSHASHEPSIGDGENARALDILTAIRTLMRIGQEQQPATPMEDYNSTNALPSTPSLLYSSTLSTILTCLRMGPFLNQSAASALS
jgi:hypothetical protein